MSALGSNLEKARAAQAKKRANGPLVILNPIEKAQQNPSSLRLAINGKCFDCQGQNADPGVIQRIRTCEIPDCTLYPVRPYQKTTQCVSLES